MQSSFRSLEIHSKWRFKICIRSVILGEFESFRNYKGFSIIFPKILDVILKVKKWEFFWFLYFHHIFESEKFRFPLFLRKMA